MAVTRLRESRLAPWAALVAAALAATINHQLPSDLLRFECRLGSGNLGLIVGLSDILIMGLGAAVSWASIRGIGPDDAHAATRLFIARLGLAFAALLAVMVIWQTLATFMVPACPD